MDDLTIHDNQWLSMGMDTFEDRLRSALSKRGWTQSKLAEKLGLSQPAVSQILSGRKSPARETLAQIARHLNVSIDWLQSGGSESDSPAALRDSFEELSWHERQNYGDGTRQYGNMRAEVFESGLPTLARETGQNASDAAIGPDITMEYRLGILSGSRLARFKTAIGWDVLEPHYRAVSEDRSHRTTRRYRDGLAFMDDTDSLWVLRIDDYGTTGLIGDEFGEGCFSALVRRTQDSQKKDAGTGAGGRFGLGSGILSALSSLDLVLFSSNLSRPVDGRTEGRFIGRAFFPFHEIQGTEFEGPFFFGKPDSQNPVRRLSAWASPELLENLWLSRRGETGTSILVVGFFDPNQGISKDSSSEAALRLLHDEFVDNFWPAIATSRLSVSFSRYENDRLIEERRVDSGNLQHPCKALLDGSIETVEASVSLSVPKSRETSTGPYEHNAKLILSKLGYEAMGGERLNEVALCRKPLMVVKYIPLPSLVLGAIPFRAILLAGEAANESGATSIENAAAENFLSKAEPPQHDEWTSRGTDLVSEFRGGAAALKKFNDALKQVIKQLVSPDVKDGSEAPRQLRELLSLPGAGVPPSVRAFVSAFDWVDDTKLKLKATIKLTSRSDERFSLTPVLGVAAETGGNIELPCSIESIANCTVTPEGTMRPTVGAREMSLLIEPHWDEIPVRPDLSALSFDVSLSEKAVA